jgi:hypothetical protein
MVEVAEETNQYFRVGEHGHLSFLAILCTISSFLFSMSAFSPSLLPCSATSRDFYDPFFYIPHNTAWSQQICQVPK